MTFSNGCIECYQLLPVLSVLPSEDVYTKFDNLIPGMTMWKKKLLTCALAAAVAFEILFL
jgi:hypothetical protein